MASYQDKLLGAIREVVRQGSNVPSDADLAAFVDLVRTDTHGEALLSSLLKSKEASSTSASFGDDDESWKFTLQNQTPAVSRLFGTMTVALLEVTAKEIGKEAKGKVTVWPAGAIPLVTARYVELQFALSRDLTPLTWLIADTCLYLSKGTLYFDTVEQLNGGCGVTVSCSGDGFTARFWRSESRLGKGDTGDLIAVFIGEVDAAALEVKAFSGEGGAVWENLREDRFPPS